MQHDSMTQGKVKVQLRAGDTFCASARNRGSSFILSRYRLV